MEKISDQIVIKELNTKAEMLQAYQIVKQRYASLVLENF